MLFCFPVFYFRCTVGTQQEHVPNFSCPGVVKQGSIFDPVISRASTSKVNNIDEKINYNYGNIQIGMPVFMDDIAIIGSLEVKRGTRNCTRLEEENKFN